MDLTPEQLAFVEHQRTAAMITIGTDGMPKPVRVGIALVDGRIWSSGTAGRVRTRRLRHDPRCTLFVFDGGGFGWLGLETEVTILDGPEAAEQNVQLFRIMQNRPSGPLNWFGTELDEPAFLDQMRSEGRLVYEFNVNRGYGLQ